MLLHDDSWDLKQLASDSGLSTRTIRFYQNEGLLPNPGVRGLKGRYGPSDLDRLRLIKLLQRQGKTLAEVREELAEKEPEEIGREAARREVARESAAGYARSILDSAEQQGRRAPASPSPSTSPVGTRSTYDRITITPDIELHVRGPLSQFEHTLLLQLLREADRIFHTRTRERR